VLLLQDKPLIYLNLISLKRKKKNLKKMVIPLVQVIQIKLGRITTKINAKELQSLQGQILEVLLIIRNKEDKENHLQQEMIDSKKEGQNQLWLKLSLQKKKLKIKSKRR
jgi:hypothetical protein